MANDAEMICPQCQSTMAPRYLGDVTVHQCSSCQGVFLERADLGNLIEAENDWHRGDSGPKTMPLPRITADMAAPPPSRPVTRAYVETLFS
jgi:Zn-finger nucleic acid-binding protein